MANPLQQTEPAFFNAPKSPRDSKKEECKHAGKAAQNVHLMEQPMPRASLIDTRRMKEVAQHELKNAAKNLDERENAIFSDTLNAIFSLIQIGLGLGNKNALTTDSTK